MARLKWTRTSQASCTPMAPRKKRWHFEPCHSLCFLQALHVLSLVTPMIQLKRKSLEPYAAGVLGISDALPGIVLKIHHLS